MPSPNRLQNLVKGWYSKSQSRKVELDNYYDKFIALWLAFNAWGTSESQQDRDIEMLNWVKDCSKLPEIFTSLMGDDNEFQNYMCCLKRLCPVLDMRPGHSGECRDIVDVSDFKQVLHVIYQIRCNLFHGSKEIDDDRDNKLVTLAYRILGKLFSPIAERL